MKQAIVYWKTVRVGTETSCLTVHKAQGISVNLNTELLWKAFSKMDY